MADEPWLQRGSSGDWVSYLQQLLESLGFSPGAIDGDFGPITEGAVRAFQEAHECTVDGIVGPQTWGALNAARGGGGAGGASAETGPDEGSGPASGPVPEELVAMGLPADFGQWSAEQRNAVFGFAEPREEIEVEDAAEPVELLAINETGDDSGETLA